MTKNPRRRIWVFPALLLLGVGAVVALAAQQGREDQGIDAACDLDDLARLAPQLDATALTDEALLALGGQAITDVLDHCAATPDWVVRSLERNREAWVPSYASRLMDFSSRRPPQQIRDHYARVCDGYAGLGGVLDLRGRERGPAAFELCRYDDRGILDARDVEYISTPWIDLWGAHQMLLDSGLSKPLARRYFLAMAVAGDIDANALGTESLVVRDGAIVFVRSGKADQAGPSVASLDANADLIRDLFYEVGSGNCWLYQAYVAAAEPMRNLTWLLDAPVTDASCLDDTLTLTIFEREQLLRPVRATLDFPDPAATPELELSVDVSGAWRSTDARDVGSDASAIAALLDRRRPASLRLRVAPDTPAARAVDLARAAHVWRAQRRSDMRLWLAVGAAGQ